jgi:hypothetical protein
VVAAADPCRKTLIPDVRGSPIWEPNQLGGDGTKGFMAINNNSTTGVGIPYQIVVSGTSAAGNPVNQQITQTVDGHSFIKDQARGPNYFLTLATTSDTCQLTVSLVDVNNNASTIDTGNTYTYTSRSSQPTSAASFSAANMGTGWQPSTLMWNSDVATVSSTGLITANAIGKAVIEIRYPLVTGANPQFITAFVRCSVL